MPSIPVLRPVHNKITLASRY